jgi:hypothetical protein
MMVRFSAEILKGNVNLTGFVKLPKEQLSGFNVGQCVKVRLEGTGSEHYFTLRNYYAARGFFLPREIVRSNALMGKRMKFCVERVVGFPSKIGADGRIYLPLTIAKKSRIQHKDVVCIKGVVGGNTVECFSLVTLRRRGKHPEYKCNFINEYRGRTGLFFIRNLSWRMKGLKVSGISDRFISARIDRKRAVLFLGNRRPVIINYTIKPEHIAHYLGAYFADGTKRGNNWAICASTFEQAQYYLTMHNELIAQPVLDIGLTYTSHKPQTTIMRDELGATWTSETGITVPTSMIRIIQTQTLEAPNRNQFGALVLREPRQLVLLYYNALLSELLRRIEQTKDKGLALTFLCGVMEGDGSPSATKRGFIVISTNRAELSILQKVFLVAGFRHKGYVQTGSAYIRVGSLELLNNILFLAPLLFKYYPKRRKRFIERFMSTGAAGYLLGTQTKTSAWVLRKLRDESILDDGNLLTTKGKKIRRTLKNLAKSVTVL